MSQQTLLVFSAPVHRKAAQLPWRRGSGAAPQKPHARRTAYYCRNTSRCQPPRLPLTQPQEGREDGSGRFNRPPQRAVNSAGSALTPRVPQPEGEPSAEISAQLTAQLTAQ